MTDEQKMRQVKNGELTAKEVANITGRTERAVRCYVNEKLGALNRSAARYSENIKSQKDIRSVMRYKGMRDFAEKTGMKLDFS